MSAAIKDKSFAVKRDELMQARLLLTELFNRMHRAGANRHAAVWFEANRAAINAAWAHGQDPSKLETKAFIAELVLRVLDATQVLP